MRRRPRTVRGKDGSGTSVINEEFTLRIRAFTATSLQAKQIRTVDGRVLRCDMKSSVKENAWLEVYKEKVIRDIEMVIGKKDSEYLQKLFDNNNLNYFGNKLTKPVFKFYTAKSPYGRCVVGSRDGKVPTKIWISKNAHNTHEDLEDTVRHEMIHQFIYEVLHGPKYEIFTHGVVFRSVCFFLRCKYGVKIKKPVSFF